MTKQSELAKREAIEKLRAKLPPGSTVQTILRHVSRSGMMRSISPIVDGQDVSYLVQHIYGARVDQKTGGLRIGGAGMDMGFHLVYELSASLYPQGFDCIDDKLGPSAARSQCPANDHRNARDGSTVPQHHADGGYALKHRWL